MLIASLNPIVGFYTSINDSYPYSSDVYVKSLQLKADSSFIYIEKLGSFIKTKTQGRWSVVGDSLLLKSNDFYQRKMKVVENLNNDIEKGYTKIFMQNLDKSLSIYHLKVLKGKKTIEVRDVFNKPVFIKKRRIDKITIITPSLEFPTYHVANKKMNDFIFNLVPHRIFIDEKWLMQGEKIFPKKFNGNPANYYLEKQ